MEMIEVRDRRGGFLWVSNQVFDHFAKKLNSTAFMLYLALCRMVNNETQECFPSQPYLAKMIGIDERTVRRVIEELTSLKLVGIEKVGRAYRYTLLKTPDILSGIDLVDTGHPCPPTPDNSYENTGHQCPPNKTNNKTQEQDSLSSPSVQTGEFELNSEATPPSKKKKQSTADSRHRRFIELIFKAHEHFVGSPPNLGPATGRNLLALLKGDSRLDEKRFIKMLRNYHESDDHARADSPAYYIPKLPKYELGPLNQWGRQEKVMGIGQ